jgi:hypothetical protein
LYWNGIPNEIFKNIKLSTLLYEHVSRLESNNQKKRRKFSSHGVPTTGLEKIILSVGSEECVTFILS